MKISAENLSLRPYSLNPKFIFDLHNLVTQNEDELAVDFPNVPGRYRTFVDAARSVRRAKHNPDIDPYAILVGEHDILVREEVATFRQKKVGRPDSGMSLWVKMKAELAGGATLIAEDADPEAVYGAWWIDKDHQGMGIGTFAASALISEATISGQKRFNAYIRPANTASTAVVEELGFKAIGKAASVDLGDSVTAPRQKFSLELA